MRYDTVIFDLDGTLLDTLGDLADSVNYALAACGLPQRTLDEVQEFVGNGVASLVARAVPTGTAEELRQRCLECFRAHYALNMENKTAPYPGVLALLEKLHGEGRKLAIVSNKFDRAVKGLAETYFAGHIRVAIGERDGVAKKPAPDTVFTALAELGTTAERAVYVGDSDVDVDTAKNAGLPCIGVSWGFRGRDFLLAHGAEQIADDVETLYELLSI